ncbi:MAG: hypothetical protein LBK82_13660, partial [Planctomycetaceae bacterium]|nr:hypothetical protein [Planctomycetaceae bacterium]
MNRISFPRILNFVTVVLILGLFYILSLPKNTAQEAAVPATVATENAEKTPESVPPISVTPTPPVTPATEPQSVSAPETPPAVSTSAPATPVPATSEQPTESKLPESTPAESGATPITFPIVNPADNDPNAPSSFADVPGTATTNIEQPEDVQQPQKPFWETFWKTYSSWIIFLLLVSGCFFAGQYFAKIWRLPEHNIKIFIVLLAFLGSIAAVGLGWHRLTLGIDLQGGVVLIYDAIPIRTSGDADNGGVSETPQSLDMDKLTRAITKRINPGGVREISITKLGTRQIQVVIPRAEDAEVARIERVISESGSLTFRILASKLYEKDKDIISRGEKESGRDVRDAS